MYHPFTEEASVTTDGITVRIPIKPKAYDFVVVNRTNPFTKPYREGWWRTVLDNTHVIVGDRNGLFTYTLIYVEKPKPIIVEILDSSESIEGYTDAMDCQLDPSVHRRIVTKAAHLAKASAPDPTGFQIQAAEQQLPSI
jgi:hypothetical protein